MVAARPDIEEHIKYFSDRKTPVSVHPLSINFGNSI